MLALLITAGLAWGKHRLRIRAGRSFLYTYVAGRRWPGNRLGTLIPYLLTNKGYGKNTPIFFLESIQLVRHRDFLGIPVMPHPASPSFTISYAWLFSFIRCLHAEDLWLRYPRDSYCDVIN